MFLCHDIKAKPLIENMYHNIFLYIGHAHIVEPTLAFTFLSRSHQSQCPYLTMRRVDDIGQFSAIISVSIICPPYHLPSSLFVARYWQYIIILTINWNK